MERLTYKTNGKYINTVIEQAAPYAIDCDIYTAIAKLAEYEDLEEQGKLLKLPCAVGDTVWDNDRGTPSAYNITGFSFGNLNEDEWEDQELEHDQILIYASNNNRSISICFAASVIGKEIFLTKEEAEAALKKLKGISPLNCPLAGKGTAGEID